MFISGKGNREEIVIEAVLFDDLFVNVCAENIKFENLTFIQVGKIYIWFLHFIIILCDDLFVNVCAENIKFENLTFVQVSEKYKRILIFN